MDYKFCIFSFQNTENIYIFVICNDYAQWTTTFST